jgi:hypothetical protein
MQDIPQSSVTLMYYPDNCDPSIPLIKSTASRVLATQPDQAEHAKPDRQFH